MIRSLAPRRRMRLMLLAATALVAFSGAAFAQDATDLGEVIITATKQGETSVQNTPLAVSVVSAQAIEERGLSNVQDLVGLAPGLQVSDLSGYTQVYIRGVGSNIVFIGSDPSSTTHLDGVYLARPLSYLSNFLDVERIELLRGPQGTLYGRNAVGGNINIVSRRPTEELEGRLQATVGDYGQYGLAGYVSGPLGVGGMRGSLAFNRSVHDGYLENVSTGGDLEDEDFWGARGQLYVPLGADADFTLRVDRSVSDSALGQYPKLLQPSGLPLEDGILGDYHRIASDTPNRTLARIWGAAGEFNLRVNDNLNFRSLTAYRSFAGSIEADADSSSVPLLHNLISPIRQEQFSQEFNLTGSYDRFNFVLGAYYFNEQNQEPLTLAVMIPDGGSHIQRPDLTAESAALFAQGEYFITPALSVLAGVRWTQETKHYLLDDYWTTSISFDPTVAENAPLSPNFSPPFHADAEHDDEAVTPKIGLNYRLNEDALLYVSATRGFKSGGFDYGSNNEEDAERGYRPEYLWAYEIGAKTSWFADRLRANVSAFYYDYTDMQVQSFRNLGALTQNAATAEVTGVELELMARPTTAFELHANIAYLDAHYVDYEGAFTNTLGTFSADGNTLNNAPEWAATIGGRYTFDLGNTGEIYLGADARYQSEVFFTAANDGAAAGVSNYPQQQDAYTVVSGRVGWTSADGDWDAVLIGDNLTDEDYITGTADYPLTIAGRPGHPRTVRLQLSRSF